MSEFRANEKLQSILKKNQNQGRSGNFYGALKSKNEIYYQMASLFKEVTKNKNEKQFATQWMDQIIRSNSSNIPGKFFINIL